MFLQILINICHGKLGQTAVCTSQNITVIIRTGSYVAHNIISFAHTSGQYRQGILPRIIYRSLNRIMDLENYNNNPLLYLLPASYYLYVPSHLTHQ